MSSVLIAKGKREEDYLRVIYEIERKRGIARVKDIAEKLDISLPSVVGFLDGLSKKGLIVHEKRGRIKLTDRGIKIARCIISRRTTVKTFLKLMFNLTDKEAETNACYIEHGIDNVILNRMEKSIKFMSKCKSAGKFLSKLHYFYEHEELPNDCS